MWHLLVPDIPIAEKIVRSAVIYVFLLLAIRFTGKRQVGQLTPFDLVVLLILSNVVQNAVIGNDNSLGGGIIGALTILVLNAAVVEVTYRSKRLRRLLEPSPTLLIHNGKLLEDNLRRERVTHSDLFAALRRSGVVEPSEVRFAVLEDNGAISVVPHVVEVKPARPPKSTPECDA
ncbi:MAG TPA: YetF domain-containing protein [Candidatus Binatia bacterium]|nr:YetF domain-containing protein [Candidatus Binatia bacterium]